ncbi:MAG: 3-keto-5-aminohexanoate cleavage protein [Candidatus Zixiibacteriota bacterium]|nr:MAG: 3-keto-5-aminohexanoate cleavage protein [candidate division Zixibacteria bacterium]
MKMDKLIINVAVTGMIPGKNDNPNVPITPDEIAEDCHRCYEAGALVFHLHARDKNGEPTYGSELYHDIITKVRGKCPDAVICVSTSGRVFKSFEKRSEVLNLDGNAKPDMASLTLGSLNFPQQASVNEPDMIQALAEKMNRQGIVPELEVFDMGMLDYAKYLIDRKVLHEPFYFNLLLGSLGTLSATPFHLSTLAMSLPSNATWAAAGIGKFQFYVNSMAITMGGHVRVGLEDNIYMDTKKQELATNLKLVERLVRLARSAERETCTPIEARKIIGLAPLPR